MVFASCEAHMEIDKKAFWLKKHLGLNLEGRFKDNWDEFLVFFHNWVTKTCARPNVKTANPQNLRIRRLLPLIQCCVLLLGFSRIFYCIPVLIFSKFLIGLFQQILPTKLMFRDLFYLKVNIFY